MLGSLPSVEHREMYMLLVRCLGRLVVLTEFNGFVNCVSLLDCDSGGTGLVVLPQLRFLCMLVCSFLYFMLQSFWLRGRQLVTLYVIVSIQ